MSFFDALIDLSFKTDADGNTVFYPYGFWFKGRLVDDDKREAIKTFLVRFWVVQFGLILVGTIIDNILILLAAPFLFLWYHRSIKRLLKDTPIAETK